MLPDYQIKWGDGGRVLVFNALESWMPAAGNTCVECKFHGYHILFTKFIPANMFQISIHNNAAKH